MRIHNIQNYKEIRQELRNNPTSEETLLWKHLQHCRLGFKFRRQHSIGPYIVDFYCAKKKLIIEVDGKQHLQNLEYDEERTMYLKHLGYKVIRFWNSEINNNIQKVVSTILKL
jgi:very-short-patch-repair endonuclease